MPVGDRPVVIRVRTATQDQLLAIHRHLAQPGAHADPMGQQAGLVGLARAEIEPDRAVDRTLLDRIPSKRSILRIDPGSRGAIPFLAVGPRADAELGPGLTTDEEVAIALVRDDPAMPGIERDGVTDVSCF